MVRRIPISTDKDTFEYDISCESREDFVVVQDAKELPMMPKSLGNTDNLELQIHPCDSGKDVLIRIQPPLKPTIDIEHIPCDIVLVIDVSGSMNDPAALPDVSDSIEKESAGLSILDLTKHAARTILETLNDQDRLALVTFSSDAEVVQPMISMTKTNKLDCLKRIESLQPLSCTNLWSGIRTGLSLFENASSIGNVQGIFVLTDGMPNYMCPRQGYVAKLQPTFMNATLTNKPLPIIHTFGFGYAIKSELMQAIAEVGGGRYAFIPDAGIIGTVFVHAVANLYTTFATAAQLEVESDLEIKHHSGLELQSGRKSTSNSQSNTTLKLDLGSLHYGQSRDIMVELKNVKNDYPGAIKAKLTYRKHDGILDEIVSFQLTSTTTDLPSEVLQYHQFRTELCESLSRLFPINSDGERVAIGINKLFKSRSTFQTLAKKIEKSQYFDDPDIKSLYEDIDGQGSNGQILKALTQNDCHGYWAKWGQHYLRSLLHAHLGQVCNTFKDPGPLRYGKDSPVFNRCRDQLDNAFDTLPAPKPSLSTTSGRSSVVNISMQRYNSRNNPCFEANSRVRLSNGSTIPVCKLHVGMDVWTPSGSNQVKAVVKTHVNRTKLCKVGDLWVTQWHPIRLDDSWIFPIQVAEWTKIYTGSIYSVMLTQSTQVNDHAIEVEGQVAVTLGHGVVKGLNDARVHPFFGNHNRVTRSLMKLPRSTTGVLKCLEIRRDRNTGLACGFIGTQTKVKPILRGPMISKYARRKVSFRRPNGHLQE